MVSAAAVSGGKRGRIDQAEIARRTAAYQKSRGLKADGLVNPGGPTELRLAADLHGRQEARTPPPHRRALGRGANVPVHGSVGAGQSNLPRDVQTAGHALRLVGQPLPDGAGPDALTSALRTLQAQHGLKLDGVMTPFGPTHDLLDDLTAPRLQRLIGSDPAIPLPFAPQEVKMIGRTLRLRPTTIRTREQDEASVLTEADWRDAAALGGIIAGEMRDAAVWDRMGGGEPAEGGLRVRMAAAAPDLTGRQLDEYSGIATKDGIEFETDEQLLTYVEKMRQDRPDHHAPIEEELRSGELTIGGLEDRVGLRARGAAEQPWNRDLLRRFAAHLDVLTDRYIEDARRAGIDLDRDEARARARKLAEAATADGIDADTLGEMLLFALDFAPVVGEVKSAVEAVDLYRQMLDAEEKGEDAGELRQAFLFALAGAMPVLGKFVKGAKLGHKLTQVANKAKLIGTGGQRHRRQMLKKLERLKAIQGGTAEISSIDKVKKRLTQTAFGASLKEQAALRKWYKFLTREQKKGRPLSIKEFARSNPHLAALSRSERLSLQNTLNPLTGTEVEVFIRGIMDHGKLAEFENGEQVHSLIYDILGRPNSRILDAATEFDVVPALAGVVRKRVKRNPGRALGLEFKGARGPYPKTQRDTDAVINRKGNSVVAPQPGRRKNAGPNINKVALMRIAVTEIPKDQYEAAVVRKLVNKGYSEDVIVGVLGGIDIMYRLDSKMLEKVTLATASAAALASAAVLAGELSE
ncbi:MAG: hypothetical protein ACMVY4_21815 [Minwuia sp.]|uniref:hypothetical protein n=1 Tax=Minwuia sp. TaxID=2493630 RepID=UPI003A858AFA